VAQSGNERLDPQTVSTEDIKLKPKFENGPTESQLELARMHLFVSPASDVCLGKWVSNGPPALKQALSPDPLRDAWTQSLFESNNKNTCADSSSLVNLVTTIGMV